MKQEKDLGIAGIEQSDDYSGGISDIGDWKTRPIDKTYLIMIYIGFVAGLLLGFLVGYFYFVN